jgi:two-component system sensor histidine kinase TctE
VPELDAQGRSLQRRIDTALLYPLGAVMLLAAGIAYYLAVHFSRVVHDHWLSDSVNSLVQVVARGPGGPELDLDDRARALFGWDAEDKTWFRLVSREHGTIGGSADVPIDSAATSFDSIGETRLFDGRIGGERVRVASLDLPAKQYGDGLKLLVAETVRKRARTAREIGIAVLIPQLLLTALAVALLLRAVHRTVRPFRQLAAQLGTQSHSSLNPLPLRGAPLEVHPLIHAVNDLLAQLKAIFNSKEESLATAAHDLRTPLAAALLHLECVQTADTKSAEALATAQTAIRRATRAASQFLSLAHAEATAADPASFTNVDLCALAQQIGSELAPTAISKRLSLSLEVPRETVLASGNYDLLVSAVGNLLDNAIKYTPSGGDVVVTVCDGDRAGIRITDTGPGLPELAGHASGRFVRGVRSMREGIAGAGLGLAIAREVARRHRGDLELVCGPEGRGTAATLWIQRAQAG